MLCVVYFEILSESNDEVECLYSFSYRIEWDANFFAYELALKFQNQSTSFGLIQETLLRGSFLAYNQLRIVLGRMRNEKKMMPSGERNRDALCD